MNRLSSGPLDLRGAIDGPEKWQHYRVRPLALSERTLAEIPRDAGYQTAGVVAGPWLKQAFGPGGSPLRARFVRAPSRT